MLEVSFFSTKAEIVIFFFFNYSMISDDETRGIKHIRAGNP